MHSDRDHSRLFPAISHTDQYNIDSLQSTRYGRQVTQASGASSSYPDAPPTYIAAQRQQPYNVAYGSRNAAADPHDIVAADDGVRLQQHVVSARDDDGDDDNDVLKLTVEIEEGRMEVVSFREGDCVRDVAERFCMQHSVAHRYVSSLSDHILATLDTIGAAATTTAEPDSAPKLENSVPSDQKELKVQDGEQSRRNNIHTSYNAASSAPTTAAYYHRKSSMNKPPKLCTHKLCSLKPLLSVNDPTKVIHHKKMSRMNKAIAAGSGDAARTRDHHVLPSFATLARFQQTSGVLEAAANDHSDEKKKKKTASCIMPRSTGQLSHKPEKAVYTRLYVEFLHHKQRMEDEKKACLQQFQEKLEREKPAYTKKTKRLMSLRGRAAKQFKNYGELLYQEALKKEAERRKIAEQRHLEEESQELKGVTASPEISEYAKQLKRPDKFWERLSTDNSKRHLRELQHESLEMKLMECTFTPRINKTGVGEQDTGNANRFDQLFWDAENRRHRQAEYMRWHPEGVTFRPMINPQCCQSNMYGQDISQNNNVFSRLLQYAAKLSEKKEKWQKNVAKPVDPTTGQELFHPQTGRKPYGERKTEAMPIGDFLYQLKFSLDSKRQTLMERDIQKAKELANCQYVNSKSSKLLESRRLRIIKEIFDLLDTDKDGIIDLTKVDMSNLRSEVVEDINEVRQIGSAIERHLSLDKFTRLMMSIPQKKCRSHLLQYPTKKKPEADNRVPLKFKVNRHSCRLASGVRKPGNYRNWYKLVLLEKERRQARIEALRKDKENQELAECTFKPSLHKKDCKGSASFIHGYPVCNALPPHTPEAEKEQQEQQEQQEIHGFFFQEVDMDPSGVIHTFNSLPPPSI